ncbi:MAG: RsmB/NOP family class I SAM-dependent RNA methyltransferase [Emcibacteraceae bacterium]|nr:RsmB/NOP family class I SAM-dependent RNA methyltransferase [Emcibacteraceae bacterium]
MLNNYGSFGKEIYILVSPLNSREASFFILKKIMDEGATIEGALSDFSAKINEGERGFVRHLVATTMRRMGQIDKIIDHLTKTKLGNTQTAVRHILRLGVTQLLYMDVPAYAAVDGSVKLADKRVPKKLRYLKNTVNAVLRNVDRERDALLKRFGNTRLNFPQWLLKSWDNRFGNAAVKEVLSECLKEAPLDIRLKPELDGDAWAEQLGGKLISPQTVRLEKAGKVFDLPGYDDGHWWIQDAAASIPETLLGANAGDRVLDLCAAPGGKAAQCAARGALVTAVDMSAKRLKRLRNNMERLDLDVDVVTSDALDFTSDKKFDFILLDAPCSSTGTIRRHPEMLHLRWPRHVKEMAVIQSKLLKHAAGLLNEGGTLIYSVCSLEKEEGPDQINTLLAENGSLKRKEILKEEIKGVEQAILETGDVQTLPHYISGGMDGFFISRITKQ